MKVRAKLCGLTTEGDIDAAAAAGAAYIGLVFFEKSPRNVYGRDSPQPALRAPVGLAKVALVVNADDAAPGSHYRLCSAGYAATSRRRNSGARGSGKSALRFAGDEGSGYCVARRCRPRAALFGRGDQLLLDAKPAAGEALPGGNGLSFDWRLLEGESWSMPWMLAGGLTPDNVAEAVRYSGARQVDVSSGIETAPGQKSAELMAKFVSEANR